MCLAVRGITGGLCLNGVVCRALRLFGDLSISATAILNDPFKICTAILARRIKTRRFVFHVSRF